MLQAHRDNYLDDTALPMWSICNLWYQSKILYAQRRETRYVICPWYQIWSEDIFCVVFSYFFFHRNQHGYKKCNICSGRILSHSRTMTCVLCCNHCHLKCISLNNDDRSDILRDTNWWYCHLCLSSVVPFNHIGDKSEFYKAICTKDIRNDDLLDLSDKVFNPLENLDRELNDLLDEYDPDLNFTMKFIKNLCINVTTWQNPVSRTSYHYPRV